jgi:hypothetical protein
VQPLTRRAVAVFCVEWHLPAQLVFHPAAVTPAVPPCLELFVLAVDPVRLLVLPRVIVACAGLELVASARVDILRGYPVTILLLLLLLLVLWRHAYGMCSNGREGERSQKHELGDEMLCRGRKWA